MQKYFQIRFDFAEVFEFLRNSAVCITPQSQTLHGVKLHMAESESNKFFCSSLDPLKGTIIYNHCISELVTWMNSGDSLA